MTKRIRIIDIAEKTGVSIGTVDRVLHNRGHVNPDVRQRVLDVMGEMGYEPNIIARTLAQNKAHRIVALLPNFHNDPYWVQPKEGCEKAAQAVKHYGVSVDFVFFDMFNPADFEKKAEKWSSNRPTRFCCRRCCSANPCA